MGKQQKDLVAIRGNWKVEFGGWFVGQIVKVLGWTLRVRVVAPDGMLERLKTDASPVIFCVWHNQLLTGFLRIRAMKRPVPLIVLTSASKDGAGLAALAKSFGNRSARGSSSRRGRAAMMTLLREIKNGNDAGFTPDGPRGPRYGLQGGVVKIAQASGAPILVMRFEYDSAWRMKTWDAMRIPKPFSKVTLTLDEPLAVPRRLDEDEFEAVRSGIEERMREGLDDIISDDEHRREKSIRKRARRERRGDQETR